jgi:hypothetical protein
VDPDGRVADSFIPLVEFGGIPQARGMLHLVKTRFRGFCCSGVISKI